MSISEGREIIREISGTVSQDNGAMAPFRLFPSKVLLMVNLVRKLSFQGVLKTINKFLARFSRGRSEGELALILFLKP